jgi:hypothetical protein
MTDSSQDLSVLSRRRFLFGTAAAAGGAAVVAVTRQGSAQATNLYNLQGDWGFCTLCHEVFYAGPNFRGQGVCPKQSGDGHANPQGVSYNYSMVYNQATTSGLPGTPGYQSDWFWCRHCYALWWPGANPPGCCPAEYAPDNGQHSKGASYTYAMPVNISGASYQGGWNFCDKCGTQYWSSGGPGTDAGFCWVNANTLGSGKTTHSHGGSWPYKLIH